MNLSKAIQHLEALAAGMPVDEAQAAAFRHWVFNEATSAELEQLAAAHESLLMAAGGALAYDSAIAHNILNNLQAFRDTEAEGLIEQETPVVPMRSRRNYWWGAAAVLFLILGAGAIWFMRQEKSSPAPRVAAQPLQPGGNKALLTLANGQQIQLDQAATGQLASAAGVHVVKLDSGLIAYQGNSDLVEYHQLSTPRGGQFRITLPDGTGVWLNSVSSLRFPNTFTGSSREVELSGEAYFEVAQQPGQPFIVKAGAVKVQVLGTSFDLMAYEDEAAIRTTVLTGAVSVQAEKAATTLGPGTQASLYDNSTAFTISRPNVEEIIAWKNGQFWFGKTNIRSIMRQLTRWYDMQVVYQGNVENIYFEGVLSKKGTAAELLDAIAATGEVHFKITGSTVTVIPGKE
ncbi:FecR family protein [uncultured Chitinophaga sp.]|jgi:Fe2+-dicitrate sensor, membrane component|uniref:FecR family protein n=1 Tax=uncultured Chitinophaga sp. TaxID=339340 RepID=UPI00261EBD0B|nr:FecR family protein [uncultured Chitinophaga sp.]